MDAMTGQLHSDPPSAWQPPERPGHRAIWLAVISAVCAVTLCYLPAIDGGFLFDDLSEIRDNPAIRSLWPPTRPMLEGGELPHRPIPYLSFAISHSLGRLVEWWSGSRVGHSPAAYRIANLLIHLLNGFLLWFIVRQTLVACRPAAADKQTSGGSGFTISADMIAYGASLIWLVHPLQTQAVSYIYQRIELLAALAALGTLAAFIAAHASRRPSRWLLASAACCALGMACKESVAVVPPLVLLYDRTFFRGSPNPRLPRRGWYFLLLFGSYAVLAAVLASQRGRYPEFSAAGGLSESPLVRSLLYGLNQPAIICWYLSLIVWPRGQSLDHGTVLRRDLFGADFWVLLPVVMVAAALLAAIISWRRQPAWAFAVMAFFLLLAPTSSLLPVYDVCVEHRMYLPSAVPIVAATIALASLADRLAARRTAASPMATPLFAGLVLATCLLLGSVTAARNTIYSSPLVAWRDAVEKSGGSTRSLSRLGNELSLLDHHADAIRACVAAVERDSTSSVAHAALAAALINAGRHEEAVMACRSGLRTACGAADSQSWAPNPVCDRLAMYLGVALERSGNPAGRELLEHVVRERPDWSAAREYLAEALARDDKARAIALYESLIVESPADAHLHFRLGSLLAQSRPAEAMRHLLEAVRLDPLMADAHNNLGNLLLAAGRRDEAIACYETCLRIDPTHPLAGRNLEAAR
jgi:tetratricopeptide (TPR) repeat protein